LPALQAVPARIPEPGGEVRQLQIQVDPDRMMMLISV
jgi:hypothetical protein